MAIFKGAGVAIVTPMYEDGKVNFEQLEHIVDWQIENGTDAIIICGTTGESSTLSEPEHVECIKVAVAAAGKRVPVIAGTGSNDTQTAIYLTKEAQTLLTMVLGVRRHHPVVQARTRIDHPSARETREASRIAAAAFMVYRRADGCP